MKKVIYILLGVLVVSLSVNVWQYNQLHRKQPSVEDTSTVWHSYRFESPFATMEEAKRTENIILPLQHATRGKGAKSVKRPYDVSVTLHVAEDTTDCNAAQNDSVEVEIPITQKMYKDSLYTAWVSGYHPTLDSIEVYSRTTTIRMREKPKRWGVGVQSGYGMGRNGLQLYIGIGVSYNLFRF